MTALIKKIHMYIGLLNFSALVVFGVAGLTATFQAGPGRQREALPVRYLEFPTPPNASDKEVADRVYETLRIPLAMPIPKWALRRDRDNQLALDFYTINGIHKVTVLEKENKLRIETERTSPWQFMNNAHSITVANQNPDLRIRLWGAYNEFAIWSLMAMAMSGVYLWLASRPRFRWAQYSFAAGSGVFVLLYVLTR